VVWSDRIIAVRQQYGDAGTVSGKRLLRPYQTSSERLVRPQRSILYRTRARRVLQAPQPALLISNGRERHVALSKPVG
jgi:hypothetical protein